MFLEFSEYISLKNDNNQEMFRNLYDIFDLPDFFDDENEFDRLYRVLGSRWHPRRNINMYDYAERRFKELSKAYAILADREKRKRYNKLLSEAPHEDHFTDILAPFHEDKGLDHYDGFFNDFLGKRNKLFNDDFFKETDKEFKDLDKDKEHVLKSVKSNTIIKNGKRITKKTKTVVDKDGNKTIETQEDHGDGKVKTLVTKIFHDKDGNLIKEVTEDIGEGPKVKEQKMLALNDKKKVEDDIVIEDETNQASSSKPEDNKMVVEENK